MLEPWMIEKEEQQKEKQETRIQLPVPNNPCEKEKDDVQSDRGVVKIEYDHDEEEN